MSAFINITFKTFNVLYRNWLIMSAPIANLTDNKSPFQLSFYIRLQATSPTYVALDSIHLVDCYKGYSFTFLVFSIVMPSPVGKGQ